MTFKSSDLAERSPARTLAQRWSSGSSGPSGLERVARAATILEQIRLTLRAASETAALARTGHSGAVLDDLRRAIADPADTLTAIAAVHALALIAGDAADEALIGVLSGQSNSMAAHAAWASTRRAAAPALIGALSDLLVTGGLAGMHAQRALARWAQFDAALVATALRRGLRHAESAASRRQLVETLGLLPDPGVTTDLITTAVDAAEADGVRVAAIAALAERRGERLPAVVSALAEGDGRVAHAAHHALVDRLEPVALPVGGGLRLAQVHLAARLDARLASAGVGDTGGIATLVVKLGEVLASQAGLADVLTIGRGAEHEVGLPAPADRGGQRFASVVLEDGAGTSFVDRYPALVAAEHGLRRIFRRTGTPDLIHLRMADVGTLAAANVATQMGIPTVFSLAPDPHALIAAREQSGELDRRSFAAADAAQALWYRVSLVERLVRQARHVVLFPREKLADDLRHLVGVDVDAERGRFTVVPEGIDVMQVRRAIAAHPTDAGDQLPAGAVADLLDRLAALPRARHGLPLVLSVGRMSEVKGVARLVEAFAADPALRARATLVIVGGDLEQPTAAEADELARIHAVLAGQPALRHAVVLLGHRPNGEVAQLLAAVRLGVGRLIGANGAYACASRKEEFGLAIVEALAAGLPVVAPQAGGPTTYVVDGWTGSLADTTDPLALARATHAALDLAPRPGRAAQAAATISQRYDISIMARTLAEIYGRVVASSSRRLAS